MKIIYNWLISLIK